MINLRLVIICIIIGVCCVSFFGCSGSSSNIRYNDKNQTEKSDSQSVEDIKIVFEDEISEKEDPSDLPDDESKIDITEVLKKLEKKKENSNNDAPISTKKEIMLMEIIRYLNTPYKYGGNSLDGIDCSAFTQCVFKNSWLLDLNRTARDQFQQGHIINDRSELKFGDLVFFNTRRRVKPGHVGIYIGENFFAHASTKLGVTISSLEHTYYDKRYMGARRIEDQ